MLCDGFVSLFSEAGSIPDVIESNERRAAILAVGVRGADLCYKCFVPSGALLDHLDDPEMVSR